MTPSILTRRLLARFPRAKAVVRRAYYRMRGMREGSITREIIRKHVSSSSPVIVEIGANDGEHTAWFLEIFENPTIYCFEPDPRAIARFKSRFANEPRVRLFEAAVSDREGELTFYQSDAAAPGPAGNGDAGGAHDASGSIRAPKNQLLLDDHVVFRNRITVPTTTLDAWCARHGVGQIDFVWMDVQGAEIDVFRGGREALARTRLVYTEYSDMELYEGQAPLSGLLAELGRFRVLEKFPCDVLLGNRSAAHAR